MCDFIPFIGNLFCLPFDEQLAFGHSGWVYERSLDDNFRKGKDHGRAPFSLCEPTKEYFAHMKEKGRKLRSEIRGEKRLRAGQSGGNISTISEK